MIKARLYRRQWLGLYAGWEINSARDIAGMRA
jgi:hypothetical protein